MIYQCPYCGAPFRDAAICKGHMKTCSKKSEKTIDQMTVKELKALAKEKNIEGYDKMNQDDLIKALKG